MEEEPVDNALRLQGMSEDAANTGESSDDGGTDDANGENCEGVDDHCHGTRDSSNDTDGRSGVESPSQLYSDLSQAPAPHHLHLQWNPASMGEGLENPLGQMSRRRVFYASRTTASSLSPTASSLASSSSFFPSSTPPSSPPTSLSAPSSFLSASAPPSSALSSSLSFGKLELKDAVVQTIVPAIEYVSPQTLGSFPHHDQKLGFLHRGACAGVFIFLVFSALQFPDGILIRPTPVFWRLVKGSSVLYLLVLVFLLFQDLEDVRTGLNWIDSRMGVPLPEKSYAENCHLATTVWDSALDVFVFAHFFGWLVKTLVVRDGKMLFFVSVAFEWMEITFRHILPNFWECWWDHVILDVFGCNLLGILAGMKLCHYFEMKEYRWRAKSGNERSQKKNRARAMCGKAVSIFTPYEFTAYKWPAIFSNGHTFVSLLFFSFCLILLDLNVFFLKAELLIESTHYLILIRLAFWCLASASGTREFYDYITDDNCKRLGVQCWLSVACVIVEGLLSVRWSGVLTPAYSCPQWIVDCWYAIIIVLSVIMMWLLFFPRKTKLKIVKSISFDLVSDVHPPQCSEHPPNPHEIPHDSRQDGSENRLGGLHHHGRLLT